MSKNNQEYEKCIFSSDEFKLTQPLYMEWNPKEDMTAYELALCLKYLLRRGSVMPCEVNLEDDYLRHFDIIDPN